MKLRIYAFYRFSQYFMLLLNVFQYFLFLSIFHLNQNFSNSKIFVSVLVQKSLFLSLLQIVGPFLFPSIFGSILIPNHIPTITVSYITLSNTNSKNIKLSLSIITYYYILLIFYLLITLIMFVLILLIVFYSNITITHKSNTNELNQNQ